MWIVGALLGIVLLSMVIHQWICGVVEKRAMHRMRETERNAAFIDARNLMVEYG
jgi:hypothetical protein